MKDPGFVYILTNPSFREDWVKIGKSSRPVNVRSKELDNTAVPLPFEIFATLQTVKFDKVEKLVHKTIDRLTDLRIRQNREFFNVPPQVALDIFRDIAQTIDDAVVTEYKDNKPFKQYSMSEEFVENKQAEAPKENKDQLPEKVSEKDKSGETNPDADKPKLKNKPRFKFSMVDIKIGEQLTFIPTGITVKVASDDSIEYDGRIYKLSPFVGTFLPENMRNHSGAYQGPLYFSYNGERLTDLRRKKEQEHATNPAAE